MNPSPRAESAAEHRAGAVMPLVVEHADFGALPAACWDALNTGGGLYTSQRFMAALESVEPDPGSTPRCLEARDGNSGADGTLAVLPCFDVARGAGGRYDPDTLIRAIDPDAPAAPSDRSVLLGPRTGYSNRLLSAPGVPEERRRGAVRALLDAAVAGRRQHTWSMPYLDTASAREFRAAVPDLGFVALVAADTVIDVPDGGLEAHLDGLSSKRRVMIRRELRRFAESECRLTVAPLRELHGELAGLLAERLRKYGGDTDEQALAGVLEGYGAAFGDDVQAIVARLDGRAVAYATFYRWKDALFARSWGCDPDVARDAALYFNLVYYEPLRIAPALGVRRVHYGILAYQAKVLRGARLEARWTVFHRPRLEAAGFAQAVARWNDRQVADFQSLGSIDWRDTAASLLGPVGHQA